MNIEMNNNETTCEVCGKVTNGSRLCFGCNYKKEAGRLLRCFDCNKYYEKGHTCPCSKKRR